VKAGQPSDPGGEIAGKDAKMMDEQTSWHWLHPVE
jgi:hypothetical protein